MRARALAEPRVAEQVAGKQVAKVVIVPGAQSEAETVPLRATVLSFLSLPVLNLPLIASVLVTVPLAAGCCSARPRWGSLRCCR